jgi:rare lipoprotein A
VLAALGLVVVLGLAGCASAPPPPGGYRVKGQTYVPLRQAEGFSEVGVASWYGRDFHGRRTANGEIYDMYARTAAHKLLPLGTTVRVTNLENGRQVVARINDRGPFVDGRIIDLSYALARDLGIVDRGVARVRVVALAGPGGSAPPTSLEGPFTWQVGAFTLRDNAEGLARSLQRSFGTVAIVRLDRGDAVFHRVRVGRYPSPDAAEADHAALARLGLDPFLVRAD